MISSFFGHSRPFPLSSCLLFTYPPIYKIRKCLRLSHNRRRQQQQQQHKKHFPEGLSLASNKEKNIDVVPVSASITEIPANHGKMMEDLGPLHLEQIFINISPPLLY